MGRGGKAHYIFELQAKLVGLGGSMPDVAEKAAINYYSLKSDARPERSMMSMENQEKIASAYGFSVEWEEWHDPKAGDPERWSFHEQSDKRKEVEKRRDYAQKFLFRWRHGAPMKLRSGPTGYLDSDLADFHIGPYKDTQKNWATDEFLLVEEIHSRPIDIGAGYWVGLRVAAFGSICLNGAASTY